MHADELLRIETPEQVALELPVAGIGSRFLAVTVDTVLQLVLCVTAAICMVIVAPRLGARAADVQALVAQVGPTAMILFVFCVYWGYFAFFETIWSGRTPGKRLADIRVVKESGRAINVYEAIARNILRAIDFLPMWYGVGVVVMMVNRNSRRIGDYVAGTLVVHDRLTIGMRPTRSTAIPAAGAGETLTRMTTEELVLIETYLQRRTELEPSVRDQMAEKIADRILRKTGLRRDPERPIDDFLESIARGIRDNARFR